MRETSDLYKRLLVDPSHAKENRLTIGGEIYDESQIVTLSTNEALFAEDTLSVGGAIAREIAFAAFLDDSVPKRAQIIHEVRLITSTQASEWLQKGVYYISTRSKDPLTGVTTVHGFDAMMTAEQEWKPAQTDIFPMPMKEAVEKTAAILQIGLDPRNVFKTGDAYMVDYPVADGNASEEQQTLGLSIRQVWRWVAGAMGGNFIINDLGQLRLVPVNDATATAYLADENGDAITFGGDAILLRVASTDSPELSALGAAAASVQQFPAFEAISRVILKISRDQGYMSGSDTGRTIEIDCAYGSQTMANDLLAQLRGYVYQPLQAEDALIDPAAELGDPVEVGGVYAVLAQKDTLWDMLSAADIAAPGGTGPEDEYAFTSAAASKAQYELAHARSLISKTNDRISMEIFGEDGKGGLNGKLATFTVSLSTISSKVESVETKAAEDLSEAKKALEEDITELDESFSEALKNLDDGFTSKLTNYSTIEQTNQKIASEVGSVKAYTDGKVGDLNTAVSLKLESYSTIEQTDQKIASEVKSVKEYTDGKVGDLNTAVSLKLESYSTIEQTDKKITSEVGSVKEYTDGKVGDLNTAVSLRLASYSTIEQTDEKIATRVAKDGIISAINQSAEEVQISASKINLNGYVSFTALETGPNEAAGQSVINGGWIGTNTLQGKTIKGATYYDDGEIGRLRLAINGVDGTNYPWLVFDAENKDKEVKELFSVVPIQADFGWVAMTMLKTTVLTVSNGVVSPSAAWNMSSVNMVASSKNYGSGDPPKDAVEGQVYFKLVS